MIEQSVQLRHRACRRTRLSRAELLLGPVLALAVGVGCGSKEDSPVDAIAPCPTGQPCEPGPGVGGTPGSGGMTGATPGAGGSSAGKSAISPSLGGASQSSNGGAGLGSGGTNVQAGSNGQGGSQAGGNNQGGGNAPSTTSGGSGQTASGGNAPNTMNGGSGQTASGGNAPSTMNGGSGQTASGGAGGMEPMSNNVKAPASSTKNKDFFVMGDLRLINNAWGSAELGCNSSYNIFINADKSFGWEFDRGSCGDGGTKPDYPEVEFGIHPFGNNKGLVTSPDFSSTKILPIQIKDVQSASAKLDNLKIQLSSEGSFNMNFEMWLTEQHPVTGNHNNAYAELMTFWAWENGRWACDKSGTVKAGDDSYQLCHQSDNWAAGWRYYQYRVNGGPKKNYNGRLDIKAMLDALVKQGLSKDLWISRFEIGTEIGDKTKGRLSMKNVTFEVNGMSKSAEID